MVQSYNWEAATTQLRGMAYHNCFRQELGYCSVDFFITNDGTSPDYYDLNGGNQNAKVFIYAYYVMASAHHFKSL